MMTLAKNTLALLLLSLTIGCQVSRNATTPDSKKMNEKLSYLALGDSYTIGEGVREAERYPVILKNLLASENIEFSAPHIIATTGWTTDELKKSIAEATELRESYDLVTLLIGVNNQYRGRSVENYEEEFGDLLDQAIAFAGGRPEHVFVLSIPDWGITPFAKEKDVDQSKVAREIDLYNQSKERISSEKGVVYTDITEHYRMHGAKEDGVVADNLHPSGKIYQHWAEKLKMHVVGKGLFK